MILLNAYSLFLLTFLSLGSSDSNADGLHLYDFKASVSNFTPSGWLENSDDTFSPCEAWQYVTCTNGSVTSLSIPGLGVQGVLRDDLSLLENLNMLNLQNNSFRGAIPMTFGNLKNLKYLYLNFNNFSGEIPESLSSLNLTAINLANNNLSGYIPSNLQRYPCSSFLGNSFLKNVTEPYCAPEIQAPIAPENNADKKSDYKILIGAIIGSIAAAFVVLSIIGYYYAKKKAKKDIDFAGPSAIAALTGEVLERLGQVKKFSYQELSQATNKFSAANLIGEGGAGKVYQGTLPDGSQIAIKRLKVTGSSRWQNEFVAEVQVISNAVHRNLLKLEGFCCDNNERMLVYPLMSNGSVSSYLLSGSSSENSSPLMTWQQRYDVAVQVARALSYMHNDCNPPLIHRDVKAANILLNRDMEATLGDFGLAISTARGNNQERNRIRGTLGYMAPETFLTGETNEKTDVYGFGVFLLELVTGKMAHTIVGDEEGISLHDWAMKIVQERRIPAVVDGRLPRDETFDLPEMERLVHVGLLCMQQDSSERPTMAQCVATLECQGTGEIVNLWREQEVMHIQDSIVAANAQSILNSGTADPYQPSVELFQLVGPR